MKYILFSLFILSSLFSKEIYFTKEEQIKKAELFEKNHELEKALYWYKQASTNKDDENSRYKENYNSIFDQLDDIESKKSVFQILGSDFGLYPYKKNYVLPYSKDFKAKDNRKEEETIFQISVKIPLTYNLLSFNEQISIGYTQKSWWQTFADSKPFRETNHNPEVFMMVPINKIKNLKALKFSIFHESNGRSIVNSRSWNGLEIGGFFQVGHFFSTLGLTHRFDEKGSNPDNPNDDDNPSLMKYRGHVNFELNYLYKRHIFSSKFLLSEKKDYGSQSYEWSFPLSSLFTSNKVYGMITYFNGYSESLIDYDKKVRRVAFGIQLSR